MRRLSTYDTVPEGFTRFAKYQTWREAEEVRAYLGQHGVRAEVDDRRAALKRNAWHGAVLVYVAQEHLEQAKAAFAARASS